VSNDDGPDGETLLHADRGLDLTDVEHISAGEQDAFREFYRRTLGTPHPGLNFWLEERPETLKRYRLFAELLVGSGGSLQHDRRIRGFAFMTFYALTGYEEGVRYLVHIGQTLGLTKDQVLEGLGIAFLHGGPRGMETIALALADYEWIEPERPAMFPDGWEVDPGAFSSGLDFSSPELGEEEAGLLEAWYMRWSGEVPAYVPFLAKNRPMLLKAHRNRYENLIRVLPKQVLPMTLLSFNVSRGFPEGIRENLLLAKGFGVSKEDALGEINRTLINAGVEGASVIDRAVGDVLEGWE
jgi:hypothetical protein